MYFANNICIYSQDANRPISKWNIRFARIRAQDTSLAYVTHLFNCFTAFISMWVLYSRYLENCNHPKCQETFRSNGRYYITGYAHRNSIWIFSQIQHSYRSPFTPHRSSFQLNVSKPNACIPTTYTQYTQRRCHIQSFGFTFSHAPDERSWLFPTL